MGKKVLIILNDATGSGLYMEPPKGKRISKKDQQALLASRERYDVIIGYGQAIEQVACHWWAYIKPGELKPTGDPEHFSPYGNGTKEGVKYQPNDITREHGVTAPLLCARHLGVVDSVRVAGFLRLHGSDRLAFEHIAKAFTLWPIIEQA